MTQAEVLNYLKKNKNAWLTSQEIGDKLKTTRGSVSSNLNKLLKQELVLKIERKCWKGCYSWKIK